MVRSIDGDSAEFNSSRVGVLNLTDGQVVDTSIHRAFVRLVRKAEKFLYIESQVRCLLFFPFEFIVIIYLIIHFHEGASVLVFT